MSENQENNESQENNQPNEFDLVVIGAGPGGYVCAIKAAQLGLTVAVVDKRETAGGTCLNIGCIPSKALLTSSHKYWEARYHFCVHGVETEGVKLNLHQMQKRKEAVVSELTKGIEFLFRKNKVTFFNGLGTFQGPNTLKVIDANRNEQILQAKAFVIATGSESATVPDIDIDEERIVSSTGALDFTKVPKHLVVVGGGYIGLELGSVWSRLGAAVTVVEYMDRIVPAMDQEIGTAFQKELTAQGMLFKLGRKVIKIIKHTKDLSVHLVPSTDQGNPHEKGSIEMPEIVSCDRVLIATGRRPYTQDLNLEAAGVETDVQGFVMVNKHYQTSCSTIFAIGDVIHGPMLAHKAEEEGIAVAELLAGQAGHVNYGVIPAVVYTSPEVASIGLTEEQAKEKKIDYKVGKFPFLANSRAKAVGNTIGFVKMISDAKTDQVLGVHIIGEQAGNMIAEVAIAMEYSASSEDIARTCHAHPTHSEALKEAALSVFSKPIHM